MHAGSRICVVIPEWNELVEALSKAEKILSDLPEIDRVIIVDDGSENFSPECNEHLKITLLGNLVNRGVGYSFVRGINYALAQNFDYIIGWTLIDRGLYLDDFRAIIQRLQEHEFVTGIRHSYKGEKLLRRIGLLVHQLMFWLKVKTWLSDTTIGIRGMQRTVFQQIKLPSPEFQEENADKKEWQWFWRYGFESWILLEAFRKKLKVSLCPITTQPARNSTIRLRGKNSFLSIYACFFKKARF